MAKDEVEEVDGYHWQWQGNGTMIEDRIRLIIEYKGMGNK